MAGRTGQRLTTASGRPAAFGTRVRERIDTTIIVKKLIGHVKGEEEMTQTQINAARILLDRTVPVLKPLEVQPDSGQSAKTVTPLQLVAAIEGEAERVE